MRSRKRNTTPDAEKSRRSAPAAPAQPPSREAVLADAIAWTARWSLRWVLIAAALVLAGFMIQVIWPILFPVLLALILCTVLAPVCAFLERRMHLPAGVAAAFTLLGSGALIVAIGFFLEPSVSGQGGNVVSNASQGLQQVQDWVRRTDVISQDQLDAALQGLQDRVQESASSIASGALSGVSRITSAVITVVISLILTFLFLKDGRRFLPWLARITGPQVGPHLADVSTRAWQTLGGFIRTQALVALIDAVFIGAGLLIVGVPLAIPLAVLTFVGGFVPIVGAFVVGAIAVLVALVSNGPTGALVVLAVIVAVQQLEGNVLSPWLQSKSMRLPAAVVLLSVTLGSSLFGITGAFLAVPAAAVAAVVLRYLDERVTAASSTPEARAADPQER